MVFTFIVPEIFTGIAFDSGGVTSGPMTASFILPLVIGICEYSGRANINVLEDAFGLVAVVAMMPLISIQALGLVYMIKSANKKSENIIQTEDNEIIIFKKKAAKEVI